MGDETSQLTSSRQPLVECSTGKKRQRPESGRFMSTPQSLLSTRVLRTTTTTSASTPPQPAPQQQSPNQRTSTRIFERAFSKQGSTISVIRRPGTLQRASSTVQESDEAKHIMREARFMESLPLKAPHVPEEVCRGCQKAECECEPDSDSESEETEIPVSLCRRTINSLVQYKDHVRDYAGRIVNDQVFQMFIVTLILVNALLIGIATFDFVEDNPEISRAFRIVDLSFLVIFTIELGLQFLFHGYNLFFDGWLVFDLVIVLLSWLLESVSVLRALKLRSFKVFRAFRLTTRIRVLRRLVEAILDVLPKITAICVMFLLISYIWAVMCTELFGEIDFTNRFSDPVLGKYNYFSRLDYSAFTLFHMVTLDWAKVTRATMQVYPWAWAVFSSFVTISSFSLYNLIVAVVCDAVKMVQDQQDVLMVENYVKDKIESRHRIINLRQKLDKMSKQQMDLLLYVQLMLEQLDDLDEKSKQHYEATLAQLGQTTDSAKVALESALMQLDTFEKENGLDKQLPAEATRPRIGDSPATFYERNRRVSFHADNLHDDATENKVISQSSATAMVTGDSTHSLSYFGAMENMFDPASTDNDDQSFHSCAESPDNDAIEVDEAAFRQTIEHQEP